VEHRFAQKYQFKGVWDAAGKVLKHWMVNFELRSVRNREKKRLATAWDCYKEFATHLRKLQSKNPWDAWEKEGDKHILNKTTFKVTLRKVGYVTEKKQEYERLANEYRNIVYSDRTYVPKMKVVKDTQKLHLVASGGVGEKLPATPLLDKLRISKMPCSCLICRGRGGAGEICKFTDLRDEQEIWVQEETGETARKSSIEPTKEKALLEKIRKYVGLDVVTVANIKVYLRLRGEKVSGNKIELAERALAAKDPDENDVPVVMPLAIDALMADNGYLGDGGSKEDDS
jgi:hypothetical protein